jgi:uncharacterized membrane protein (UPF0136 family)
MSPTVILWIYIVLLLVGGLLGFLKAGSKVSLITSAISAALLVLSDLPIFVPKFRQVAPEVIMAALLVVFAIRLGKTKKFMPSGLMLAVTVVALVLHHFGR